MLVLATAPAGAQHEHHAEQGPSRSELAAGVSLVAAAFDTTLYVGNYQGVVPSLRWTSARFAVHASGGVYRLEKNGAHRYGMGDIGVHGQATLWTRGTSELGIVAGISAPTGDHQSGLGMGHAMVMPAVFASWAGARLRFAGTLGYSRALGGETHADHGPWPLVAPMLESELSWNAGGDLRVGTQLTAGIRGSGGIPLGAGDTRAIIAGRLAWHAGWMQLVCELQAGLAGDPFTVRGVVSTTLSF